MVDVGLFLAYMLICACVIAAVAMPLVKAFGDPQSLKKMSVGVGALIGVFIISYFIADNTALENISAGKSRLVGAGLYTMYILAFVAVLGIVYTEIKKAIE